MLLRRSVSSVETPLPAEFLEWQVLLRRWTMLQRNGSPHAGVAPLVCVRQPGVGPGVTMHSIICGLLPRADQLEEKTAAFRRLYEDHAEEGGRAIYDAGIEYLKTYYGAAGDFDPHTITSLLHRDAAVVRALRADPMCALLFYVFDLEDRSEEGRLRCVQVNCHAELHERGPLFDNVWWHNAVFHGKVDEQVMVRFVHRSTWDTRFGGLVAAEG